MKVTANVLLNYIRCRRYASLNDPDTHDEPFSDQASLQQATKDYRSLFEATVLENQDNLKCRLWLSYDFHPDIELTAAIDFSVETDREIHYYCLLPYTSRDFLKLKVREGKHRYQLFCLDHQGNYALTNEKISAINPYFIDKIDKLTDRTDDLGRIVYTCAYHYFVVSKINHHKKVKLHCVLLNGDYVFDGENYQSSLFHLFDFSLLFNRYQNIIEADLYRMINHIELNDFTPCDLIKKECRKGMNFECKFVNFCYGHLPKNHSVLDYFDAHRGFDEYTHQGIVHHDTYDLINNGYTDLSDVPVAWLKNELHLMQRYCYEMDYVHADQGKIEMLLKTLKYPLIYLDFEALPSMIPRFKGESPYSQSVFQYSIHIEHEEGKMAKDGRNHFEFIAKPEYDERRHLVMTLIKIVNAYDSSVIVYHKNFEQMRLKEFQGLFPEFKEPLQRIIDRLFDLKDVLKNNKKFYVDRGLEDARASRYNFYLTSLAGSYSLKQVIKAFNPEAYKDLNIKDGVAAYTAYSNLAYMPATDRDLAINDLLEYCKQDTYAMFEILHGLKAYLSDDFRIT